MLSMVRAADNLAEAFKAMQNMLETPVKLNSGRSRVQIPPGPLKLISSELCKIQMLNFFRSK